MFIKVYNLEDNENALTTFPVGVHTIGRGGALQCNDKRVSRNHAILEVSEDSVKITSIHINPCFLRIAGSKTITILPKDSSSQLSDGDAFAFLPDTFWFTIKIVKEDLLRSTLPEEPENIFKRRLDNGQESEEKRVKMNNSNSVKEEQEKDDVSLGDHSEPNIKHEPENDYEEPCNDENKATTSEQIIINSEDIKKEEIAEESNSDQVNNETDANITNNEEIKKEEIAEGSNSDHVNNETEAVKNENDRSTNGQAITDEEIKKEETVDGSSSDQVDNELDESTTAGSSTVKPRRERCWYGAQCYRKNPLHRQDFTHPGDSDFESDPEDNRPTCSFGAACYRKNKDHRRNYKHPPRDPPKKLKNKRTRKKVDRLNVTEYDDSDLSDMSEDPFEADGDSDEYVEDSDSADTDWEDSQNVDEDSENMKRLVKEAKRFIKK